MKKEKEKEKYRIVEEQYKFYVEELRKVLWWTLDYLRHDCEFDTLEDAKKYIKGCKPIIHKI
jgi:hypothetical protein